MGELLSRLAGAASGTMTATPSNTPTAAISGKIGDATQWDPLFENSSDRVVMQMDIGNCRGGGGDPYATLKKFPLADRALKNTGPPAAALGEAMWTGNGVSDRRPPITAGTSSSTKSATSRWKAWRLA